MPHRYNEPQIFRQATTPTDTSGPEPVAVGDLWLDTGSPQTLRRCTSISPITFVTTEGSVEAPTDADYLVGTTNAGLSAEIVVGTAPGGELGGTWAAPTVDTTHSGSAHHNAVTIGADGEHSLATQVLSGVAMSVTQPGHAEAATGAETTTGTDAARAVTPDGLAGSDYGKRVVGILLNDSTALTTGDGKAYFRIPSVMNGWNLVAVAARIQAGTALVTIDIYNVTDSQDMLSTALTIDANETDSGTAATPAVINTTYDDVATADWIRIDATGAGTGTTWCYVELIFQLP